jgi:hypothetical protein
MSKDANGKFAYSPVSVNLLTELTKCTFAVLLLVYQVPTRPRPSPPPAQRIGELEAGSRSVLEPSADRNAVAGATAACTASLTMQSPVAHGPSLYHTPLKEYANPRSTQRIRNVLARWGEVTLRWADAWVGVLCAGLMRGWVCSALG